MNILITEENRHIVQKGDRLTFTNPLSQYLTEGYEYEVLDNDGASLHDWPFLLIDDEEDNMWFGSWNEATNQLMYKVVK